MNNRLLIILNDAGFFLSHRLPIALAAKSHGYEVHIATKKDARVKEISGYGFIHHEIPLSRSGINLFLEIKTLFAMYFLFKKLKPDLIHLVTIKPVLYGGMLARLTSMPAVVSAISGLGFVFTEHQGYLKNTLKKISLLIYRVALSHPNQHIIFQNSNDIELLKQTNIKNKTLIPGSGVDLSNYAFTQEPNDQIIISMASRLLIDKGVLEFITAARLLRTKGHTYKFQLIGSPDLDNPSSISLSDIDTWTDEGIVECLGYRSDIPNLFSKSAIVVLPSYYREGFPKVLIEAAACGRPVITTDLPGCRDAIIPGVTGLLIPPKNANALAEEIEKLAANKTLRSSMGIAGRKMAEERFSITDVVDKHLSIYQELVN